MVNAGIALLALVGPAFAGFLPNKGHDQGHDKGHDQGHPGPTAPIKWTTATEPHWVTKTTTYLTTSCPVSHSTVTSGTKTLTVPITRTETITVTTTTVCDLNTETHVVPTGTVTSHTLVPTSVPHHNTTIVPPAPITTGVPSHNTTIVPPPKPAPFTNSTVPSVPTQPVPVAPGQPPVPAQPSVPAQPAVPSQPSVPGQPAAPSQPGASPVPPAQTPLSGSASQSFKPAAGLLAGLMGLMLML